ncbi:uncharacterized protein LOC123306083 [Chrysoperla carnea]|uniref:uncharacterized protein LOC123306083 n=1 Tax=Chrysoperla carnea TaxID=189513 RepID=UPI001D05F46C|nr:uncharacterized protein LOC123306083 [Chrysoperla carnea]
MGLQKPASLITNIALGCGAGYALHYTLTWYRGFRYVHLSYGIMIINAGFGVLCYLGSSFEKPFNFTYALRNQLYMGAFNTDLYLLDGYEPKFLCYAHLLPAIVPLFGNKELTDVCMIAQLISNYFFCVNSGYEYVFQTAATATLYLLIYFKKLSFDDVLSLDSIDWESIVMIGFALLSARAVAY